MYERGAMADGARKSARRLGQLRILKREVELLSQRAAELEQRAIGGVGRITGMPFSGRADRVGDCAAELADMRKRIEALRARCLEELAMLYAFIDDIEDPQLRQIFCRRYIDGLSWLAVAQKIGRYDEQTPRKLHNAYLRDHRPAGAD